MLLTVDQLSVHYRNGFRAITDLSCHLEAGEVLGLVGESGCGKSTLGKAILRLLPPRSSFRGTIRVLNTDVLSIPAAQLPDWRGKQVGFIFQDPMTRFNPFMTIAAHGNELLKAHGVNPREFPDRLSAALTQVNISPERATQFPHELSGGMRQRVMIALALLLQPALLIADEPTTSLDVTVARRILDEVVALCRAQNKGMVLISHDLGIVAHYADRVAVMHEGKIIEINSPLRLFQQPQQPYTKTLVEAARPQVKPSNPHPPTPLLEVRHLCKSFRQGWQKRPIVQDVSFTLHTGEVLGMIGESGSGKSTTARMVAQLLAPDRGSVMFQGKDLTQLQGGSLRAMRRQLQIIFQDPRASLNPHMTILQALGDPLRIHGLASSPAAIYHRVQEILTQVGLSPACMHRLPQELSGGQLQRVAIARALIVRPQVLICDEPVSMLDASLQQQVLQLLIELQRSYQLSLLFITHDLGIAHHFCDRLCVMYEGTIIESGVASTIMTQPQHPYTQSLVTSFSPLPQQP